MKKAPPAEKVTIFVMGERAGAAEILFLYHPHAGIQLPAGTVDVGESAMEAALREAQEETGLQGLVWGGMLGEEREEFFVGLWSRWCAPAMTFCRCGIGKTIVILIRSM
jgi:8-oxo-dGTP pyrophosphatase MutT (NUDIX family)